MITRTRVNVLPLAISFVVKMALSLARLLATENLARFNGSHSFRPSHQVDHRENFIHYARLIAHIRSQVIDIPRNDTCATLNDNQEQVSRGYSWIGNRLVTIRVERILNFVRRFDLLFDLLFFLLLLHFFRFHDYFTLSWWISRLRVSSIKDYLLFSTLLWR